MSKHPAGIAKAAVQLASLLPEAVVHGIAGAIEACDPSEWEATRRGILSGVPNPSHRRLVADFLDCWHFDVDRCPTSAVAASLIASAEAEAAHREAESVELVWTGPDVAAVPMRRTEQVVLEVIASAQERLLIVSYAVYHIPHIRDALIEAADRGVAITLTLESPDRTDAEDAYDTLKAFGEAVASRCAVFVWPSEKRERDPRGKPGILHVKAVVADGRRLFVSSANLTEYAFTVNMELGVLLRGERWARDVQRHFDWLIERGVLERVGGKE